MNTVEKSIMPTLKKEQVIRAREIDKLNSEIRRGIGKSDIAEGDGPGYIVPPISRAEKGYAEYRDKNGVICKGEFRGNKLNGRGVMVYS